MYKPGFLIVEMLSSLFGNHSHQGDINTMFLPTCSVKESTGNRETGCNTEIYSQVKQLIKVPTEIVSVVAKTPYHM